MKLHELSPAPGSNREVKRIGRGHGSGWGKTSGKGHKGQWARSGGGVKPGFEGGQTKLAMRIPKRGFNNKNFATVFIILIFRLGASIFVPFLDTDKISTVLGMDSGSGNLFSYWDQMTGGSLSNGTLFAMSITPYINASIIIQLLTVAIKPLERLAKEGDEGRKKLSKINKLVALGLAIFQAVAFYITLRNGGVVKYTNGFDGVISAIVIVGCFVAGASLIIWLGDQISEKGIGNGISMILFAGIVSRIPADVIGLFRTISAGGMKNAILVPIILIIYVGMITLVVLMTNAERKIPVQYAKRVVGRKMYGGQSS